MARWENLNMSIDKLEFTTRTANCLRYAGIVTVKQLCELTEREIMKYRNMGPHSLAEVKGKLKEEGLRLGMRFKELETVNGLESMRLTNRYLEKLIDLTVELPTVLQKTIEATSFAESDEANAVKAMQTIKEYCTKRLEGCEGCIFGSKFLGRDIYSCTLCNSEYPPYTWKVPEVAEE